MPGETIAEQEHNAALMGTSAVLQSLHVWLENFRDFCLPHDKSVVLNSMSHFLETWGQILVPCELIEETSLQ